MVKALSLELTDLEFNAFRILESIANNYMVDGVSQEGWNLIDNKS